MATRFEQLHGLDRQIAPTIDGIRSDHIERYRFANRQLPQNIEVIDGACGVGYGAWIMAQFRIVHAFDIEPMAIRYQARHYSHPNVRASAQDLLRAKLPKVEACVSFETVEHVEEPAALLSRLHSTGAKFLIASVPNEELLPHSADKYPEHVRHYTPHQFKHLLNESGWELDKLWGQKDKIPGLVELGIIGRTIIAECTRR